MQIPEVGKQANVYGDEKPPVLKIRYHPTARQIQALPGSVINTAEKIENAAVTTATTKNKSFCVDVVSLILLFSLVTLT